MVTSSFLKCSQGLNLEAVDQTNETHLQSETGPPMKDGPLAIRMNITLIFAGSKQIFNDRLKGGFASRIQVYYKPSDKAATR
jgi:hypothetical protein